MHNELKGCGKSIALWRVIVLIIFLIGGYLMETQGGYLQCIGCIVMIMFGLVILYDSSRRYELDGSYFVSYRMGDHCNYILLQLFKKKIQVMDA